MFVAPCCGSALAGEGLADAGEMVMKLGNECAAASDDLAADGYTNSFFRSEMERTVRLTDRFFLDGVLVPEPILDLENFDAAADDNRSLCACLIATIAQGWNIAVGCILRVRESAAGGADNQLAQVTG